MSGFPQALGGLDIVEPRAMSGRVEAVRGMTILVRQLKAPVGSVVRIEPTTRRATSSVLGEVIGFDGPQTIVMLLSGAGGMAPGDRVHLERTSDSIMIGDAWLGRVVDALGKPIDGKPSPPAMHARPLFPPAANPMTRGTISAPLETGIRAIDGLLTLGRGQRIGIFAGPGIGKSTLLANIAKGTDADVNVIALVGERGREVREFIDHALGEEGLARSVVVVATGDESPLRRVRAMAVAIAAAEYFRDQGKHVLLMVDSLTRFAQSQRQIGLAAGEQPSTKGYTPSVFALLPQMVERAGVFAGNSGSITGIHTVLVEGDDMTDPVADAALGVLDGHIVLGRARAARGIYPAIEPLGSISRVADQVCDEAHVVARQRMLELLAAYEENRELIGIGAYARGSNAMTDTAIELDGMMTAFLRQRSDEHSTMPETCKALLELAAQSERIRQQAAAASSRLVAQGTP